MKRIAASFVGLALLVPNMTTTAFAEYPPTTETEVESEAPREAKRGERVRVTAKSGVTGDTEEICSGGIVLTVKDKKGRVVKQTRKPADDQVQFRFKLRRTGLYKLIVRYERGKKDPCDKSRTGSKLRITKR